MAHVTIELPSLLREVLGGAATLPVAGETLVDALEDAYRQAPALRVHLCDESGKFRPHVLCFLNDVNARWLGEDDKRLREGDQITILQAVSGG
jgi:molybdopterin converting factor small subunit